MTRNNESTMEANDVNSPLSGKRVLEPFAHQVSGRAHMLTFNPSTLCKSLSQREWNFYNKVPASLGEFIPRLKGLLFVHLEKGSTNSHRFLSSDVWIPVQKDYSGVKKCGCDQNGSEELQGQPSSGTHLLLQGNNEKTCWHKLFEHTLFKGLERVQYNSTDGFTGHAWTVDKDQEAVTEAFGKNPWALRQHKREIDRTIKGDALRKEVNLSNLCREIGLKKQPWEIDEKDRYTKAYLLLEDVTSNYQFPCILDLKIGTQLDRFDCSQAKKDKHYNLVQRSSTGSLGLRVAGMQVYQVTSGQYLCRDKYYGRGLSTKGFTDGLTQFLHNGQRIVAEVIPLIVNRLLELRAELEKQETFRFYASSVLISYEGGDQTNSEANELSRDSFSDPDKTQTAENLLNNCTNNGNVCQRRFNVHMIDFAHSTFNGFLEDKTVYIGPDKDCLHALDNLVSVLNHIYKSS